MPQTPRCRREGRGGAGPGEAGSRSVPLRAGRASPLASRPGAAAGLQERRLAPPRPRGFVAAPQYAGPARRAARREMEFAPPALIAALGPQRRARPP